MEHDSSQLLLTPSPTGELELVRKQRFKDYPNLEFDRPWPIYTYNDRTVENARISQTARILELPTEVLSLCVKSGAEFDLLYAEKFGYYEEWEEWSEYDLNDDYDIYDEGDEKMFKNYYGPGHKYHFDDEPDDESDDDEGDKSDDCGKDDQKNGRDKKVRRPLIQCEATYNLMLTCRDFHRLALPQLYERNQLVYSQHSGGVGAGLFCQALKRRPLLRQFVKHLDFSSTMVDGHTLQVLLNLPNLKSLRLIVEDNIEALTHPGYPVSISDRGE